MLHRFEFFHGSPNALGWDLCQHSHTDGSQQIFEVMPTLQRDKAHRHYVLVLTAAAKHDGRVLDPRSLLDFVFAADPRLASKGLASKGPRGEAEALRIIGVEYRKIIRHLIFKNAGLRV